MLQSTGQYLCECNRCLLIWLCQFLLLSYAVCPPFCAWSHPWREPVCTSTWNTHRHLSIYCHWFQGISTGLCQGLIYLRNKRYDIHIWECLKLAIHRLICGFGLIIELWATHSYTLKFWCFKQVVETGGGTTSFMCWKWNIWI